MGDGVEGGSEVKEDEDDEQSRVSSKKGVDGKFNQGGLSTVIGVETSSEGLIDVVCI